MGLGNWAMEALREKRSLDEKKHTAGRAVSEVEDLCTEMRGRIYAEGPPKGWMVKGKNDKQ